MTDSRYDTYIEWKNWEVKTEVSQGNALYFQREFEECGLKESKKILEIGFGECEFLIWCRENGKEVCGVEINQDLVEAAQKEGHRVVYADLAIQAPEEIKKSGPFDVICGFDVIEHLTHDQLSKLFCVLGELSHHKTRLLFRFPNGLSPFGRAYQHGDSTHQQAVTDTKLKQLSIGTGFLLVRYKNAARSFDYRGAKGIVKRLVVLVRNVFEYGISMVYFCHRVPFDPVAIAVLERHEDV
jgi:hypothetical protein